jgi:hypothetical protein
MSRPRKRRLTMEPPDLSAEYNTPLTPQEEEQFQTWAQQNGRARDTFDYDIRGAWKADARAASNGHLPDTWKKPNHPTFSTESRYNGAHGEAGGAWLKGPRGRWIFHAGPSNVHYFAPQELQTYFRTREPDSTLVLPDAPMPAVQGTFPR